MPECEDNNPPQPVIYQTAEDGLADTIKPRLVALGADCAKVSVIDESERALTLLDERIEGAIRKTKAGLLILDPLQGYLGADIDMHRANEIRPVFKRLAKVAEDTGAAIVIVGHMNKSQSGGKGMYRGLGSIDIAAAVRSILVVGRLDGSASLRAMAHLKSSLAPEGQSIKFELTDSGVLSWLGGCDVSTEQLLAASRSGSRQTKENTACSLISAWLKDGDMPATEIIAKLKELDISKRTAENAKAILGVRSKKFGAISMWTNAGKEATPTERLLL